VSVKQKAELDAELRLTYMFARQDICSRSIVRASDTLFCRFFARYKFVTYLLTCVFQMICL